MEHVKRFFNQRKIMVFLLVLLAVSIGSNVYLYFGVIKPLQEYRSKDKTDTQTGFIVSEKIQGVMGDMSVSISRGLLIGPGTKFNVSVSARLWEPYTGSKTYNFSFKIYNRILDGEYSETPIVEKTVVVHKDKDEFYIYTSSGNLTITVPPSDTPEIYIYKVGIGTKTQTWYTIEFPIWAQPGPIISPIT